ncbi:hypothetical protein AHAS_Ahas10G0073100 [Arachis hypogaea]
MELLNTEVKVALRWYSEQGRLLVLGDFGVITMRWSFVGWKKEENYTSRATLLCPGSRHLRRQRYKLL